MFRPWCGDHWGNENNALDGKRVLILGTAAPYSTEDSIAPQKHARTKFILDHHNRVVRGVSSFLLMQDMRNLTEKHVKAVWSSICYHAFLPDGVCGDGTEPISDDVIAASVETLEDVLNAISPVSFIVLGNRLWWLLMRANEEHMISRKNSKDSGNMHFGTAKFLDTAGVIIVDNPAMWNYSHHKNSERVRAHLRT